MQRFARRKARGGLGFLPPNPKQWNNEHNGLDLRDDLNLSLDSPLSHEEAYRLFPHVSVWPLTEIPVAKKYLDHFRGEGRRRWSGLAIRLEDKHVVLYNDFHPFHRTRATLMEEFFHLRLGHPCSKLRLLSTDGIWRTHDQGVEAEAFGSGAAALVPYKALKEMVGAGCTASEIAVGFQVSTELVIFRTKVTKLYNLLISKGSRVRKVQPYGHSEASD
jgi:Zn-dependent peptidase ImmA (M78 family)